MNEEEEEGVTVQRYVYNLPLPPPSPVPKKPYGFCGRKAP